MTNSISPVRKALKVDRKYSELIVPTFTAGSTFAYGPTVPGTGPNNVAEYVDSYILADFNLCQAPAGALQRQLSNTGGRAVYVCLTTEAVVSAADVSYGLSSLVTTLGGKSSESYAISAKSNGDCWLIARRTEGLRHACQHFLDLLGVRYFGAGVSWKRIPKGSHVAQSVYGVFSPAMQTYIPTANGGLAGHGPTFAGAVQDSVIQMHKDWLDLAVQQRYPREVLFTPQARLGWVEP